jgi:hypothetical protein
MPMIIILILPFHVNLESSVDVAAAYSRGWFHTMPKYFFNLPQALDQF